MNVGNVTPTPTPAAPKAPGGERLAALRALQKAIEEDRRTVEQSNDQSGKGQLLDLRC